MIWYHGVFAPNFKGRKKIVPAKQQVTLAHADVDNKGFTVAAKRERMRWSEMLKRVFEVDVTVCPKCKDRLEQIGVIKDRVVLKALGWDCLSQKIFVVSKLRALRHQ